MSKKFDKKININQAANTDKSYQWRSIIIKNQHWIVIGEVLFIVLIGYFWLLAPKITAIIDSTAKDVSVWQEELSKAKKDNANAKKLVELYTGLGDKEKTKLAKILPSSAQVPELMSQLEALFDSENIFMSEFLASKVDFGEGAVLPFNIIQIQIVFTKPDNYQDYKNVLEKLEKNVRVLNIQNIEYSEKADQFTIVAFAYFLPEDSPK